LPNIRERATSLYFAMSRDRMKAEIPSAKPPGLMEIEKWIVLAAIVLLAGRWLLQLWLEHLNYRHVEAHAAQVPAAFRDRIDPAHYARSVEYTLAGLRLSRVEDTFNLAVTLLLLFSGVLTWSFNAWINAWGDSAWALAGWLLAVGLGMSLLGWPLAWYEQFRHEQRFGFNTSTARTWWMDRLKGIALGLVLGWPLLVLILQIVRLTGPRWWLWTFGCVVAFQFLMMVLAPVVILPLFNKFSPLPEGSIKERLRALAARTGFAARSIEVMDGSRRSRHSNAFFTGLGRFRKIVLFDTLIQQMTEEELEAVLAHEIGHFKLRHVLKLMAGSVAGVFAALWVVSRLASQPAFYHAFGFEPGAIEPALLLFSLLSGAVMFWFWPLLHHWSRRFEYEADAFAARVMGDARPLVQALRKLHQENLSNLTPHPCFSGFYYSHPTLMEREQALAKTTSALQAA
jgi:STE24 endopeptidase